MNAKENELVLEFFADIIHHSGFNYRTLDESKTTIYKGKTFYCFDALSGYVYGHNMSFEMYWALQREISSYFSSARISASMRKERQERGQLACYLDKISQPYKHYEIKKREKPDFVLIGKEHGKPKVIGIETVEFTTPEEKVMARIAQENYGECQSAEELRQKAKKQHGKKVNKYEFYDTERGLLIGVPSYRIEQKLNCHANQVVDKVVKFSLWNRLFDENIILCDGRILQYINSESDIEETLYRRMIKDESVPSNGCTVAVMWTENANSNTHVSEYRIEKQPAIHGYCSFKKLQR